MGIIQRQSIKYTAINLVGVLLGIVSTLFIYPLISSEFGFIRFLQELSLLVMPALSLGMSFVGIKFYPEFQSEANKDHGFLGLILAICLIAMGIGALVGIAVLLVQPTPVYQKVSEAAYRPLVYTLIPIATLTALINVLYNYTQNFHRIAFPSFLVDVLPKFITPLILLSVWKGWLNLEQALWCMIIQLLLTTSGLLLFIGSLRKLHLGYAWAHMRSRMPKMLRYGGFVVVYGLAFILATRMDVIFLGSLTTFATVGGYSIIVFMVSTIEIPTRGLYLASYGKIPQFWANSDQHGLDELYKKVSTNVVAVGAALLSLLILNFEDLTHLMPNDHVRRLGVMVVILLGIAKLADAIGGMTQSIIYFSNRYKWALISLCVLAFCNIAMSLFLIPKYQTTGAALATAISAVLYHAFGIVFCWKIWGIHARVREILMLVLICILLTTALYFLPLGLHPILRMAIKSALFGVVYVYLLFKLQLAPDLTGLLREQLGKFLM